MLERLWAIKRPFHFNVSLKRHRMSRMILVCWALALLPTVPLWFDSTIAADWEGKENCKCFMPLNNVSMRWETIKNLQTYINFKSFRKFGWSGCQSQTIWYLPASSFSYGSPWLTTLLRILCIRPTSEITNILWNYLSFFQLAKRSHAQNGCDHSSLLALHLTILLWVHQCCTQRTFVNV